MVEEMDYFDLQEKSLWLGLAENMDCALTCDWVAHISEVNDRINIIQLYFCLIDFREHKHRELRLPLWILLLNHLVPNKNWEQIDQDLLVLEDTMQLFDCHLFLKSLDTADHVGHVPAKLGFVVDKI